jgi:hypothetical protein
MKKYLLLSLLQCLLIPSLRAMQEDFLIFENGATVFTKASDSGARETNSLTTALGYEKRFNAGLFVDKNYEIQVDKVPRSEDSIQAWSNRDICSEEGKLGLLHTALEVNTVTGEKKFSFSLFVGKKPFAWTSSPRLNTFVVKEEILLEKIELFKKMKSSAKVFFVAKDSELDLKGKGKERAAQDEEVESLSLYVMASSSVLVDDDLGINKLSQKIDLNLEPSELESSELEPLIPCARQRNSTNKGSVA